MAKSPTPRSPLVLAAEKLDESVADYGRVTRDLLKCSLDSQRNLKRAADAITRLAQHDEALATNMRELGAALNHARDVQQADAEKVQARIAEVIERQGIFERLLERFDMLGQAIKTIGALLDQLRVAGDEAGLHEAVGRLRDLSQLAKEFAQDAQKNGFPELANEGHVLKQQLESVGARANQLDKNRPQA